MFQLVASLFLSCYETCLLIGADCRRAADA